MRKVNDVPNETPDIQRYSVRWVTRVRPAEQGCASSSGKVEIGHVYGLSGQHNGEGAGSIKDRAEVVIELNSGKGKGIVPINGHATVSGDEVGICIWRKRQRSSQCE